MAAAEAALQEPGAESVDLVSDGATVATIVLTADGQGFVLPTSELPALGADRTYQLWVVNDQELVVSAESSGANRGPPYSPGPTVSPGSP